MKTGADIITILRNVTGRIDKSDPLFTDTVMLERVNDFLAYEMSQELRLYENKTWWQFTAGPLSTDPFPVDLETLGFTTIGPPAYVIVTDATVIPPSVNLFDLRWYQDPAVFFSLHPQISPQYAQRPMDVLYYNDELVFRPPFDQDYDIKIQAYAVESTMLNISDPLSASYFWRYVAYGAALDIFSDYGETDKYNAVYPAYQRYRNMVVSRTNCQLMNQRTYPQF